MGIVHGLLALAIGTAVATPAIAVASELGQLPSGASVTSTSFSLSTSTFQPGQPEPSPSEPVPVKGREVQLSNLFWLVNGAVTSLILSSDYLGRRRRSRLLRDRGMQLRAVLAGTQANPIFHRLQSLHDAEEPALLEQQSELDVLRGLLKRACMTEDKDPILADIYWEILQVTQGPEFERLARALTTNRRIGSSFPSSKIDTLEGELQQLIRDHLLQNLHPHPRAMVHQHYARA